MRWLALFAMVLVVLVATAIPTQAASPALTVLTPSNGQSLSDTTVTVAFRVDDFQIVPSDVPLSEAGKHPEVNRPGQGHLHFMLDLQPLMVWYQDQPFTFNNVPPGQHQLMVSLANNDHSSLTPAVTQSVRFTTVSGSVLPETGAGTGAAMPRLGWLALAGALLVALGGGLRWRRVRSPRRGEGGTP